MEVLGADERANKWHPRLNEITRLGDLCDRELVRTLPPDAGQSRAMAVEVFVQISARHCIDYAACSGMETPWGLME